MSAAVPVQTPLTHQPSAISHHPPSLTAPRPTPKRKHKATNSHQPLQRRKLNPLNPLPQPGNLLLDPSLRLLNLQLLHIRLLPDPPLLQIQIQPDTGLGPRDLVAQPRVQLGQLVGQPLVRGARQARLGAVGAQQLGAQLGEVDFLRVGGFGGVFAQHHGAGQVLDGFFDHVGEDLHGGDGLRFGEAFVAEALHEFERVEVVVARVGGGCGEGAVGAVGEGGEVECEVMVVGWAGSEGRGGGEDGARPC